jgi:hypothetical protein
LSITSKKRSTRLAPANRVGKNFGGSSRSSRRSGSQGFCPKVSRSAISAITVPSKNDSPGSGIGSKNGSDSSNISSR